MLRISLIKNSVKFKISKFLKKVKAEKCFKIKGQVPKKCQFKTKEIIWFNWINRIIGKKKSFLISKIKYYLIKKLIQGMINLLKIISKRLA